MPNEGNGLRLSDGQFSWLSGVNSDVPRTKRIDGVIDDGVLPNQASWLINASCRGGGLGQRPTLHPLVQGQSWVGLYQGGMLYQPDYGDPILILSIGGRIYRIRVDTDNSVTDLSTKFTVSLPSDQPHFFMKQAEMFGVIQIGDFSTLPLFYDFGAEGIRPESLRQSNGIVNPGVSDPLNELPAAGPMDYYAQRLWYAFARAYTAGDIVLNQTSGTAAYDYRDSVLKVTENPVAYAGDAFAVPTTSGDIRALAHASNIDSQLGDAQLYVFTRRAVYACLAPVNRDDWVATDLDAQPLQKVALNKGGSYSDRCVVPVNGDLFFQGPPNGDIRSIASTQRQFGTWGYIPLSSNVNRALDFNDRSLLRRASGILYDNRMLQTTLPVEVPGVGVGHQAIIPLDFDTISTFEERKPPAWEGVWDVSGGPYILQMFEGDFGGRERAFAVVWSIVNQAIEVWEIRGDLRFDGGNGSETSGNRVTRVVELPAYAFGDPFQLKTLDGGELWFDKLLGTADIEVYYRPDSYACWQFWHAFQLCASKDCREDLDSPCLDTGYPQEPNCEQDAIPEVLPKPPIAKCITGNRRPPRPANWGYQFQVRLIIKGWCRIRGIVLYALPRSRPPYANLACPPLDQSL